MTHFGKNLSPKVLMKKNTSPSTSIMRAAIFILAAAVVLTSASNSSHNTSTLTGSMSITPDLPTPAPPTPAPGNTSTVTQEIVPSTAAPTPAPDTPQPSTPTPSTGAPLTPAPSTPVPAPPTPAPATPMPPTAEPKTPEPPTPVPPPTPAPSTPVPETPQPPTPVPPPTPAPSTPEPQTPAPSTPVPPPTPMPPTAEPQTPAPSTPVPPPTPRPSDLCYCYNNAWRYFDAARNRCHCYCRYPFAGARCDDCRDPTAVYSAGTCTSCLNVPVPDWSSGIDHTTYVVSGQMFTKALPAHVGCDPATLPPLEIVVWGFGRTTPLRMTYTLGQTVNIPITCDSVAQSWHRYGSYSIRHATEHSRSVWLGSIQCVPSFDESELALATIPTNGLHFHALDRVASDKLDVLALLVTIWKATAFPGSTFAANGVDVTITFFDSDTVLSFNSKTTPIRKIQEAFNNGFNMVSYFAPPSCNLVPPSTSNSPFGLIPRSTDAAILVGDLRGCTATQKTDFNNLLIRLRKAKAGILWAGGDPSAPSFVYTSLLDAWKTNTLYTDFKDFLVAIQPVACASTIVPAPKTVGSMTRTLVTLRGLCKKPKFCCFGAACSQFVSRTSGVANCHLPLAPVGNRDLRVIDRDGAEVPVSNPMTLDGRTGRVSAYYYSYTWDTTTYSYLNYYISGSWSYLGSSAQRVNTKRCCKPVGIGFDTATKKFSIMGEFIHEEQCFDSWYGLTPVITPGVFAEQPLFTAAQCWRPLIEDMSDDAITAESTTGSLLYSLDDVTTVAVGGESIESVSKNLKSKINKFVARLLATAKPKADASAMLLIRNALRKINIVSSYPRDERPCGPNEAPENDGKCYFVWSEFAKDAGNHLMSAGFERIETDAYLRNTRKGDIVVYPAMIVFDNVDQTNKQYPNGFITVKVKESRGNKAERDWMSSFLHTRNVYRGLYDALDAQDSTLYTFTEKIYIYRLREDAEEAPQNEETFTPLPITSQLVTDASTWIAKWHTYDRYALQNHAALVTRVNDCFKCPASFHSTEWSLFPAQLWRMWAGSLPAGITETCWQMWPSAANGNIGVRCCYQLEGVFWKYVPEWPSRMIFGPSPWLKIGEEEAEKIACSPSSPGYSVGTCRTFEDRRPAPLSTNSPFEPPQKFTPVRRRGGGFGDPHCTTYDGTQFECNFKGEALFTSCGDWQVHVVAQNPKGQTQATVYTHVAVKYKNDTFIGMLDANRSATAGTNPFVERNFTLLLNDDEVNDQLLGEFLTVTVLNNTVQIEDVDGNIVIATFTGTQISLQLQASEGCFNRTNGLTGNNNGDAGDDFYVKSTGETLSNTSSQEDIYNNYVLQYLIVDQSQSLFPPSATGDNALAGDINYIPTFSTAAMEANCPSACGGDKGCCFDAFAGGDEFIKQYKDAKQTLDKENENAVSFTANLPPKVVSAPVEHIIPQIAGNDTVSTIVFKDSNQVVRITCGICSETSVAGAVQCDTSALATNQATMVVTIQGSSIATAAAQTAFRTLKSYVCTALDSKGAAQTVSINLVGNATKYIVPSNTALPGVNDSVPAGSFPGSVIGNNNNANTNTANTNATETEKSGGMSGMGIGLLVAGLVIVIAIVAVVVGVIVLKSKSSSEAAAAASSSETSSNTAQQHYNSDSAPAADTTDSSVQPKKEEPEVKKEEDAIAEDI